MAKHNFKIDVEVDKPLSEEEKNLIMIQLMKKLIEIVGEEMNGALFIHSPKK